MERASYFLPGHAGGESSRGKLNHSINGIAPKIRSKARAANLPAGPAGGTESGLEYSTDGRLARPRHIGPVSQRKDPHPSSGVPSGKSKSKRFAIAGKGSSYRTMKARSLLEQNRRKKRQSFNSLANFTPVRASERFHYRI